MLRVRSCAWSPGSSLCELLSRMPRILPLWRRLGLSQAQRGEWTPPERLGEGLDWRLPARGHCWNDARLSFSGRQTCRGMVITTAALFLRPLHSEGRIRAHKACALIKRVRSYSVRAPKKREDAASGSTHSTTWASRSASWSRSAAQAARPGEANDDRRFVADCLQPASRPGRPL
jgi:hypothetical protein